jgi:hypothetical protein
MPTDKSGPSQPDPAPSGAVPSAGHRPVAYADTRHAKTSWARYVISIGSRAREWLFRDAITLFTLVLMIFTGIQVWAFVASERAFVGLTGIGSTTLVPLIPVVLNIRIRNAGRGVAFVIDSNTTLWLRDAPLPTTPEYNRQNANSRLNGSLPAGSDYNAKFWPFSDGGVPFTFTQQQIEAINTGRMLLYVYGYVTYRDEFSYIFGSRTSGYCVVFDPHADNAGGGQFNNCGLLNYILPPDMPAHQ